MFEAAKADRIQSAKHGTQKSITISFILIVISSILFTTHWRWLRKIGKSEM